MVLLAGSNVAETMPPLMQYLAALRANGGKLLVDRPAPLGHRGVGVDPSAAAARIRHRAGQRHPPRPHRANSLIDTAYIANRTEGFDEVRQLAATYWPERVERLTGVPQAELIETARTLGSAERVMVLTGRGPEQQSQGVNNALAYINIALALGQVGQPLRRLRDHHRSGKRAGRARARPEGRPASRLPEDRRP